MDISPLSKSHRPRPEAFDDFASEAFKCWLGKMFLKRCVASFGTLEEGFVKVDHVSHPACQCTQNMALSNHSFLFFGIKLWVSIECQISLTLLGLDDRAAGD